MLPAKISKPSGCGARFKDHGPSTWEPPEIPVTTMGTRRCHPLHLRGTGGERQTSNGCCDGGSAWAPVVVAGLCRAVGRAGWPRLQGMKDIEGLSMSFHVFPKSEMIGFRARQGPVRIDVSLLGGDACRDDRDQPVATSARLANVTWMHYVRYVTLPPINHVKKRDHLQF